ncbi:MAG: MFS transporter [Burkholderiales bacterium]|nr:MFS transporter [Burkholderiales bacterium]
MRNPEPPADPSTDRAQAAAVPGTLAALQARYGHRHRWLLLLSLMVGTIASVMSSTIVNVAIPDMSRHFTLGQDRAQWVSSAFMAAMTVSMLTTPWLLARYGYRRTYLICMWLLLLGGVAGGLSGTYALVLVARVAEGLAAGVVQPIPAIIILRAFDTSEQGRASGLFGMGVVLAPALGPSLGGILVDWWGWRSIFFMVVPLCLVSMGLAYRYVPTTAPGGAPPNRDGIALDWIGLMLASAGTLTLLNGLVQLHGDSPLIALTLLSLSALAWVAFVAWERRAAVAPLMNFELFRYRQFAMGSIVAFIYGTALFGSTYLLPVFMQRALMLSPSYVGTILLPAGIVLALTIGLVGRLADRRPTFVLLSVGLGLLAGSFAGMTTVHSTATLWWLMAWAVVGRIGLGFILPSLSLGAMRGVDRPLIPQGASVINFVRTLGGAAGVSVCGIVLEWRLTAHGDSLRLHESSPARLAAFDEVFVVLAVTCALAIAAAWQLRADDVKTNAG